MSQHAESEIINQIAPENFLAILELYASVGDAVLDPPVELLIPVSARSMRGNATLQLTELHTNLNIGDTLTLSLPFTHSTLAFAAPLHLRLAPLSGAIRVTVPVLLSGTADLIALDFDFTRAVASVQLAPAGTPALFADSLAQAFTAFIRSLGRRQFFRRSPAVPSLQPVR
jgi:hypothetical protein